MVIKLLVSLCFSLSCLFNIVVILLVPAALFRGLGLSHYLPLLLAGIALLFYLVGLLLHVARPAK